ncbi:hypothetical protein APHAL10511_000672 [Amanita phalloides]|nr:hypothetical protein APHAL10511_000672 [Amanita phalloides]
MQPGVTIISGEVNLLINDCRSLNQDDIKETNAENIRPQKEDAPTPLNEQEVNLPLQAFSPQEHLPNDLLRNIFVMIAEECDPVSFPFPRHTSPAQLRLSHVCSRWRILARHTFELWNNIRLTAGHHSGKYYTGKPLQEWILLAGTSTVTLSLDLMLIGGDDGGLAIANAIQNTISPFKTKKLHLDLTIRQLVAVSRLPKSVLGDIRDLQVCNLSDNDNRFNVTPHVFAHLQSVTFHDGSHAGNPEASLEHLPLPWSQLRCLTFSFNIYRPIPVFAILEQILTLQSLELSIVLSPYRSLDSLKKLTMPYLWSITLNVKREYLDQILSHFACPGLTNLTLIGSALWTDETFEIIKQQYNVKQLHEIQFQGCPLPVSSILMVTPLLRTLSLLKTTTVDDDAVTGISNGTLGRHLRKLYIYATGKVVDEIIEMVEIRKRMADMLIENGCNWREAITVLTEITIEGCGFLIGDDRVDALEKAGITFLFVNRYY